MKITRLLFSSALFFSALAANAVAMPVAEAGDDANYAAGTKALNDHRYTDALASFDKAASTKNDKADAALYWKAYTLQRLDRNIEAEATCDKLRADFRESSWNQDCRALGLRRVRVFTSTSTNSNTNGKLSSFYMRSSNDSNNNFSFSFDDSGFGGKSKDPEADMRILALNSVLRENPEKAIPQLRGLLQGNSSNSMKSHAIFILAQSKNPEAQKILDEALAGKMGPEAQNQTIRMWPVFRGKGDTGALVAAYKSNTDAKVKRSIITDLFISKDAAHMVEIARSEKDLELKRQIVSQLAIMHDQVAQDYMLELIK